jgi:hypothetical protein
MAGVNSIAIALSLSAGDAKLYSENMSLIDSIASSKGMSSTSPPVMYVPPFRCLMLVISFAAYLSVMV